MKAQSLPFVQPLSLQFPAISEHDSAMLHIHLNNAPDYLIGSVLSGSVHLTSKSLGGESVEVNEVSIVFIGRSTTSRPPRKIFEREATESGRSVQFFAFKKTLFTGPKYLRAPHDGFSKFKSQKSQPSTSLYPSIYTLHMTPQTRQSRGILTFA